MNKRLIVIILGVMILMVIFGIFLILNAPIKAYTAGVEGSFTQNGMNSIIYNATYNSNIIAGAILSVVSGIGTLFCLFKLTKKETI